jgi:NTE family protein
MKTVADPEFIKQLRGKRIGIVLSSGFFSFYGHAGFIKAFEEYGIEPVAYSGTSAGAIMAAFKSTGMETDKILNKFQDLNRDVFWDPDIPPRTLQFLLQGLRGYTGYLHGHKFRRLIKQALPIKKFEKTKTKLYVVATNVTDNRKEVFKKGDIATAVHASGAVPLLFRSVRIGDKHYVDGGLVDKAPVKALAENEKLDGIIVNYIRSRSLKKEPNFFLEKKFTPWLIYNHSYNILRHQDFVSQVQWTRDQGTKVWTVAPDLPKMGPFKLEKGMELFNIAYKQTKTAIKKNRFIDEKNMKPGRG